MDYNLDRNIRFVEKEIGASLYGWCLNEIDESGKSEGDEVVWPWSFSFTSHSLRLVRGVAIEREFSDEGVEIQKTSNSSSIRADLYSGTCLDGETLKDKVNFKMFGTNRSIKKFELRIFPVDSAEDESCSIWGSPSYDYEVDFRKGVTDDSIVISLNIRKEKFDEFARAIELKSVDFAGISIGGVSGFYSHWSPSITTSYIKVLTEYHKVDGSDTSPVNILKTGSVGNFSIALHTKNDLNIAPNFETIDFYKKFRELSFENSESLSIEQLHQKEKIDENLNQNTDLTFYPQLINGLKLPLWLIFAVLVLMFFK